MYLLLSGLGEDLMQWTMDCFEGAERERGEERGEFELDG